MKVFVTGGAGYIGTCLVPQLLAAGHKVTVFDNITFHGDGLLPHFPNKNFKFIKGDIRDAAALKEGMKDADVVIHLAAIVGFPACRKSPELATAVNVDGTRNVAKAAGKNRLVIYSSTGSNYGALVDAECTEETPLNPLSHYGKTKTEAEMILMNECDAVAYRFATAFGISPRLRLDLLINDFVYTALQMRYLVVYESHFMRTFIHVRDIARTFLFAIDNADKMRGQVYNAGSETMNYSKAEICKLIQTKIKFHLHLAGVGQDADQRNYVVSYKKISALGYKTTVTIEEGIDELVAGMQVIVIDNPYSNAG